MGSRRQTLTLDDVCKRIYSGGTPSTKHDEYWGGGLKWLSSGETSQRFIYDTQKKITEEGVRNSSTKLANKGCTVIATAGQGYTRGQSSFLMTDTYMNQSVIACEADESQILPLYLYYNLDSRYKELRALSDGTSTRGGLSGWILKRMEIAVPSLGEQENIVELLFSIDNKIELNNQLNDYLYELADALFSERFQCVEAGGLPSIEAMVELGYEVTELGSLCANVTDGTHSTVKDDPDGDCFLLSCKNVKDGCLSIGPKDRRISRDTLNQLRKRTGLERGDILLTSVGTIGELALLREKPNNYEFQRSVALIKPDNSVVSSEFLFCYMRAISRYIKEQAHGAVQQCIFINDIKRIEAFNPGTAMVEDFTSSVSAIFDLIAANESENIRLSELRDTLLPRLMSGEIDVSEVAI